MKKLIAFFSIILILFFEQSCQKIDTTDLGVGLIPTVDNVNTFDTSLEVFSSIAYLPDSSNVSPTQPHALGVIEDPEFGRTSGSISFEILPPTSGVAPFGITDSIKGIDSVVLSLGYTSLYGDSNAVENFSVFEIAQSANFGDSSYRVSDPDFPVVATALGQKTVDFTTLNDVQVYKVGKDTALTTESNVLRIKLNKTLGDRLSLYDTTNAYKNDSTFRTYFKGLSIKADTLGPGIKKALAYFDISDNARTRLTVYYRFGTSNGITDTSSVNFAYRPTESQKNPGFTASRSANLIRRSIAGTNYANNISNISPNQQNLYIQSSPGSVATLNIPGLRTLNNRVIHQAQLIIQKLPSIEENVFAPPILFLDIIDSAKNNRIITVSNDFSVADLNGSYNVADFGGVFKNNQFNFNLSRHIQALVTQKQVVYRYRLYAPYETRPIYVQGIQETPLRLLVNSNIAAGRVIVAGGGHPSQKMRLRIIYSRI